MKFQTLGLLILILLLAANVYMFVKLKEIDKNVEERNAARTEQADEHTDDHHSDVPFIGIMKDNLYFMDKLYFAGKAENWELAKFYHHEMEESMEQVIDEQFHYDGFDITKLSKSMFVPQFDELESAIEKKDKAIFEESYSMLVVGCNNCHTASDHGFIKVTVPEKSTFSNQEF